MEQITIDFLPAGATAVCHASQFDPERVIRMNLRNGGAVYTLSGNEIIKAKITRPDGTNIVENIENTASSYVDLVTSAGTCDVSGTNHGELVIEKDGATIGSKNFRMEVEEDAYGGAGGVVVESASGAIASFETDVEDELVELTAKIEPIQDLHGYTHPWAGGAGKNIACLSAETVHELRNITAEYIDDNNIILSVAGTYALGTYKIPCEIGKTYTVSFTGKCTANYKRVYISKTYPVQQSGNSYGQFVLSDTEELYKTLTFTAETEYIYIGFYIGTTADPGEMTIKNFMIEEGSSATEYEPYENICPISGHDEVNITHTGENLDDGETKKIEFDDTIYSAELDAKNGKLAKDGYIESYNGETIEEPWISSKDAFVPGTTPTAGAQVVYKKSNPDKVTTGKANFPTLTDQTNHVYNDTGDTSLKYYKREGRATA